MERGLLPMNEHPGRKELLNRINEVSFAVDDVKLYLNTHPWDDEALAYFQEYSKQRNEALREYARLYGPLTVDTAVYSCSNKWDWIDEPWPWQEGGC